MRRRLVALEINPAEQVRGEPKMCFGEARDEQRGERGSGSKQMCRIMYNVIVSNRSEGYGTIGGFLGWDVAKDMPRADGTVEKLLTPLRSRQNPHRHWIRLARRLGYR